MAIEKLCKNCGTSFSVRSYRGSTAFFCSYRCCAQYRKNQEYANKKIDIEKQCVICEVIFLVKNNSSSIKRKTCSVTCKNKLQGIHLSSFPKSHKRDTDKLLPAHDKKCLICFKDFQIARSGNSRQQCCSKSCGAKLMGIRRRIPITKEDFIKAVDISKDTYELCDLLRCSLYTIMKRSKEFGIPYRKITVKIRSDGYFQYNNIKNHRKRYEKYHGITLKPKQPVHHIDGDKLNNENIENLIHCDNFTEHSKIHASLQKIAFQLVKDGLIGFDREKKEYYKKVK